MNTVKILHTADVHIGMTSGLLGERAASRRSEVLMTFEKALELAAQSKVDVVAVAGDLFDGNRVEESLISAVFEKISSISPIRVVYAAGNHDPLNSESPFRTKKLPKNLYVMGTDGKCVTLDDIRLHIWGRSFEAPFLKGEELFSQPLPDEVYINLMVQHGELKSDISSEYNAITQQYIKSSGMDYIALGHIHKRTEIGRIGDTFFAYCGCPEGQGFDETDEKGVYMGEIGKGICNLEFVPLSRRMHICERIDITDCHTAEKISSLVLSRLSEKYGESYRENLYKAELTGAFDGNTEAVFSEAAARLSSELYYIKLKDRTECGVSLEELSNEKTLKGIFVKKMLEKRNAADESEKPLYTQALMLGLKAFTGDVKYIED